MPADDTGRYRAHQVSFDLVPPDVPVMMGSVPPAALGLLKAQARIHRPLPEPGPSTVEAIPLIVIQGDRKIGDKAARRIEDDDPFGVAMVDLMGQTLVTLACASGAHALMELPSGAPGLALFQDRMRKSGGFHVVTVADEESSKGGGTVFGLFECRAPVGSPVNLGGPRPPAETRRPSRGKTGRRRR